MSSPAAAFFLALGKFFFISVAASRLGLIVRVFGLPVIVGFLACGLIAGPEVLGLITKAELSSLSFITSVALAYICLSAGAEMILDHMRALFKRIVLSTVFLTIFCIVFGIAATAALTGSALLPWLDGYGTACTLTIGSVIGVIFVTGSPAAVIALISELKCKGDFTNTVLGVTVLSDIVVLIVFAIASTSAESACKHEGFSIVSFLFQLLMLVVAGIVGAIFGRIIIALLWFKRFPSVRYLIIPLGYLIFLGLNALTTWSHHNTLPYLISVEPLVVCIVAGFVASNASSNRHRLLSTLANAGGVIFLPFFTLAGAGISIKLLLASLALALVFFAVRAFAIFLGTGIGGFLSAQPKSHSAILWTTLITQAGVSLGLAAEIGDNFEGFGRMFQTSVISCVLVNSILGPIAFKIGMRRSGEIGKAGGDDEIDPDADVPTALIITDSSSSSSSGGAAAAIPEEAMALALQTLSNRWSVVLLCGTQMEADAATAAVKVFALESRRADQANKSAVKKAVEKVVTQPVGRVKKLYGLTVDKLAGVHHSLWKESQVLIEENGSSSSSSSSSTVDLGTLSPVGDASSSAPGGTVQIEMAKIPSASSLPLPASPAPSPAPAHTSAEDAHHHGGHEDEHVWKIEDHFQAICVASAAPAALTGQLHSVEEQERLKAELAAFFPSLAASSAAHPASPISPPPGVVADAMLPAHRLIKHTSTSPIVELVRKIKTLQAVSVVLPSLDSTLAVAASVRVLLDGAPKKSHLHSVRVLAYLSSAGQSSSDDRDRAFWSKLLLSLSVVPVDSGAVVAAAASKLLTVAPTRPTVLLPAAPNNRSLAELVAKKMPPAGATGSSSSSSSSSSAISSENSLRQRRQNSARQGAAGGSTSRSRASSAAAVAVTTSGSGGSSEHPCVVAAIELARMDGKTRIAACAAAVASLSGLASAGTMGEGEGGLKKLLHGAQGAVEKTTEHEQLPSWQRKDYVRELGAVTGAAEGWDGDAELAALQGSAAAARSAAEKAEAAAASGSAGSAGAMPRLQRALGDLIKGNEITDETLGEGAANARTHAGALAVSSGGAAAGGSMWGSMASVGLGGGVGASSSSADGAGSFSSSIRLAMGSLGTYGSAAMATLAIETQERRKKEQHEQFNRQEEEAEAEAVWQGEEESSSASAGNDNNSGFGEAAAAAATTEFDGERGDTASSTEVADDARASGEAQEWR